jgi:hypothetical protein
MRPAAFSKIKILLLIAAYALVAYILFVALSSVYYTRTEQYGELAGQMRRSAAAEPAGASGAAAAAARFLEGRDELTRYEAAAAASGAMGLSIGRLRFAGERHENGAPPVYVFTAVLNGAKTEIEVTKAGGFIARLNKSPRAGKTGNISRESAVKKAESFLKSIGYSEARVVSCAEEGEAARVRFAGGINVTIAGGDVTSLDCADYLMSAARLSPAH